MKSKPVLAMAIILLLVTLACQALGGREPSSDGPESPTELAASAPASSPTVTMAPEPTPTLPEAESPRVRALDGMTMVHVPAGDFLMGDDASAFAPEKPAHWVTLDAYWIDRTEVTNAQYRACVDAGPCTEPRMWWNEDLNGDAQPVLVPWASAEAYCAWVGARLPTEAEWEKAVRGTDGRIWPWGDEFEDNRANLSGEEDGYRGTAPVGSFPDDVSPYGLLDAAGNAAEWVSDWFDAAYYARSPGENPQGPAGGDQKVHRAPIANAGGGPEKCRCTARYGVDPNWEYGFRCVTTTPPDPAAAPSGDPEAEPQIEEKDDPATEAVEPASASAAAVWDGITRLQSYREYTVMRDGGPEGAALSELTAAWDAATAASWYTVGAQGNVAVEEITIGADRL